MRDILTQYKSRMQFMQAHKFRNRVAIRQLRTKIQAVQEAQRDVLETYVINRSGWGSVLDKNSYTNYSKQVEMAYKMYDGLADYGSEVLPAVADIRVAFIAGEGVSIFSENKKKLDFLRAFLKHNCLGGSKLLAAALMGEIEGKVLFVLAPNKDKKNIDARLFSWWLNKYVVERDKANTEKILSIKYTPEDGTEPKDIPVDKSVYIKIGGSNYKDDKTTTKLGKCLTQCENASRAAFDLRKNTHVFGRIFPFWKTAGGADAKTINDAIKDKSFEIGDGYAGPAEMRLLEPSGAAGEALIKDLLVNLRFVASMTGVPIHWLAWPELMSNRATAENMLEVVSATTKKERLIWEESLLILFDRVCIMAVDAGIAMNEILEGTVDVKLPLISLAALQQLMDVWTPIWQADLISTFTMRNMLPGIDPAREDELIEEERKEKAKNSPFVNTTVGAIVDGAQEQGGQPGAQNGRGPGGQPPQGKPGGF